MSTTGTDLIAATDGDLFARLGTPARMSQLARYDLFHPRLKARMEHIAASSAHQLNAPISLVSVVLDSAQFLLGAHGVTGWIDEALGTPAEWALCTHTVLTGRPYCLIDATTDTAHAGNPLLAMIGIRSYAGVPLIDDSGHVLGAHCVIDVAPRTFTADDLTVLHHGADEAMTVLAAHPA
jgi:GAF domain-containing protein